VPLEPAGWVESEPMLNTRAERAVAPRQATRSRWIDCLAADEPAEVSALLEGGSRVLWVDYRIGRVGQRLARIFYERRAFTIENRGGN
jgi:hypothetical protein